MKKASDIKLRDIEVMVIKGDRGIQIVHLIDDTGNEVVFTASQYSSLDVQVPAAPKTVTKYRLYGTSAGATIEQTFDTLPEADAAKLDFEANLGVGRTKLLIDEVQISEDGD